MSARVRAKICKNSCLKKFPKWNDIFRLCSISSVYIRQRNDKNKYIFRWDDGTPPHRRIVVSSHRRRHAVKKFVESSGTGAIFRFVHLTTELWYYLALGVRPIQTAIGLYCIDGAPLLLFTVPTCTEYFTDSTMYYAVITFREYKFHRFSLFSVQTKVLNIEFIIVK